MVDLEYNIKDDYGKGVEFSFGVDRVVVEVNNNVFCLG